MAANRPSFYDNQFFNAGVPAAGFKLYTYDSGTPTPKATYTDQAGTIPNTNPITLDAQGMCELWLGSGEYTLALYTGLIGSGGALVKTWDDVGGVATNTDLLALRADLAASSGSALMGFQQNVAGAVPLTVEDELRNRVNVRQFGALNNNGVTDDSAVFQAAAASGAKFIDASNLNCRINGTINIPSGQTWMLSGSTLTIASSTVTVFSAQNVNDWALVGPFKIVGDGSTSGTAIGISVSGGLNWRIRDYTGQAIRGHAFYYAPGASAERANHGYLSNFRAIQCYRGYEDEAGTGAEYMTLESPYIKGCTLEGMITRAGNAIVFGGQILECTDGVVLRNGSNHGHGTFIGTNISHHTRYSVYADRVLNGHDFVGCHMYANDNAGAGAVFLDRSKGVVFAGGQLDCWVYNDKDVSSGMNYIRGMYCPGSYGAVVVTNGPNPGADQLAVEGCTGQGAYNSGVTINDPSPVYVLAELDAGSTQALTSGVAADLVFNTEVFDRRGAYNNATGVFAVPAGQAGLYRITGNVMFTAAGATTASYIEVQVNGASAFLCTPSIYNASLIVFPFSVDVYLNAADTVKLRGTITATSPTHGGATWRSSVSFQRIA